MGHTTGEEPPRRVEPLAWLALAISVPPILLLLLLAVAMGGHLLDELAPRDNGQKATLYAVDPVPGLPGLFALTTAAAVLLGIAAIRKRRKQPSARNTRIATTAIVLGLLAFPLAFVLAMIGRFSWPR